MNVITFRQNIILSQNGYTALNTFVCIFLKYVLHYIFQQFNASNVGIKLELNNNPFSNCIESEHQSTYSKNSKTLALLPHYMYLCGLLSLFPCLLRATKMVTIIKECKKISRFLQKWQRNAKRLVISLILFVKIVPKKLILVLIFHK